MTTAPTRTLVYFGHVPAEGAGSAIIVYRHLLRFAADGWKVRVVADWGQSHEVCSIQGWPVLTLSHRKPWWPPLSPNSKLSRAIRAWLWAGEVRTWLGHEPCDAVFTYLSAFSDTLSLAAVGFSRRYQIPLATIIHDDARDFIRESVSAGNAHERQQEIVAASTRAWFASPELAACFQLPDKIAGILPPLPAGAHVSSSISSADPTRPLLVYAGNFWPQQLPALAAISKAVKESGGRFLAVLKDSPEVQKFCAEHQVDWRAPWISNQEALDWFAENASAMLVSYSVTTAEMPWTRTSFPSKFIEYCHLGIPILIAAPADTAIREWAKRRNYEDAMECTDVNGVQRFITLLKDPSARELKCSIVRKLSEGEFSPSSIHRLLADTFQR